MPSDSLDLTGHPRVQRVTARARKTLEQWKRIVARVELTGDRLERARGCGAAVVPLKRP